MEKQRGMEAKRQGYLAGLGEETGRTGEEGMETRGGVGGILGQVQCCLPSLTPRHFQGPY